ncbi:MAG: hypothetical protein LBN29_10300 [Mediterranea sp.]|jgi:hypothetical protein|nr:hypothetical protein [Mediterranea sp.]
MLERIVNHLILQSSFIDDIGLFYGKTGIAIALYHYASSHQDEACEVYADELIEQVCGSIQEDMPITLSKGLCGIAWGICHLMENGFLAGDVDEVLLDIDEKIMERSLCRIKDFSLETGLEGIGLYIEKRQEVSGVFHKLPPFNADYCREASRAIEMNHILKHQNILAEFQSVTIDMDTNLQGLPLGIYNGCANNVYNDRS